MVNSGARSHSPELYKSKLWRLAQVSRVVNSEICRTLNSIVKTLLKSSSPVNFCDLCTPPHYSGIHHSPELDDSKLWRLAQLSRVVQM